MVAAGGGRRTAGAAGADDELVEAPLLLRQRAEDALGGRGPAQKEAWGALSVLLGRGLGSRGPAVILSGGMV